MAFCQACGNQMADDAGFCPRCGAAAQQQQVAAGPPPIVRCVHCGVDLYAGTQVCPKCNHQQVVGPAGGNSTAGHAIACGGGALMAIGPFLPWVTAGALSADGMQKTGSEAISVVIAGVVALAVAAVSLAKKRNNGAWCALLGFIGGGLSAYYFVQVKDQIDGIEGGILQPSIGFGMYACLLGGILALVGGLVALASDKKPPGRPPQVRHIGQ